MAHVPMYGCGPPSRSRVPLDSFLLACIYTLLSPYFLQFTVRFSDTISYPKRSFCTRMCVHSRRRSLAVLYRKVPVAALSAIAGEKSRLFFFLCLALPDQITMHQWQTYKNWPKRENQGQIIPYPTKSKIRRATAAKSVFPGLRCSSFLDEPPLMGGLAAACAHSTAQQG